MKNTWIVLFSILLLGCGTDDRDIDLTFKSYCSVSSDVALDSKLVVQAICDNEKYRSAVVAEYIWFQNEADIERFFYRLFGVVVIVLSISIPVLSQSNLTHKKILITFASLSVAIGTSLSTFFNWGEAWGQYRAAEYAYRTEIRQWDIKVLRVVASLEDERSKIDSINEITQTLLDQANYINMRANKQFFEINGKDIQRYLDKHNE